MRRRTHAVIKRTRHCLNCNASRESPVAALVSVDMLAPLCSPAHIVTGAEGLWKPLGVIGGGYRGVAGVGVGGVVGIGRGGQM